LSIITIPPNENALFVFIKGVLVGNTNILFSLGTRWRSQVKR